jgi:Uma2 family endonuclease
MKKEVKKMFVVVYRDTIILYKTMHLRRHQSIDSFLGAGFSTWKEAIKCGWKCVKVNVTIEPILE